MYNLYIDEEYIPEEKVLAEQEQFLNSILNGFSLYNICNINEYIKNMKQFLKIDKIQINRIMNDQLNFFLEQGFLKNWEEYFSESIQKRLDREEEIDIEFFNLTYQTLIMTIQRNTCYSDENGLSNYIM